MAFKLTAKEKAEKASRLQAAREKAEQLASAIKAFNAALEAAKAPLAQAAGEYNSALDNLSVFAREIEAERYREFRERSESWQESDRGSTAQEWLETWGDFCAEPVELDWPEPIDEAVDDSALDDFDNLPDEASA